MNTTATPTATVFATMVTPADFNGPLTEYPAEYWDLGKLRHLLAAIGDTPVIIVTDRSTGATDIGARLVDAFYGGPGRGARLSVESTLDDGTTQITNYALFKIGAITPIGDNRAKWKALAAYRDEVFCAIETVQRAGLAGSWGKWSGSCGDVGVSVRYAPLDNPPAGLIPGQRWSGEVHTDTGKIQPY